MNATRRRQLRALAGLLADARSILEEIVEAERAALDNLPDSLQQGERFERDDENYYQLEEHLGNLEEMENFLEEIYEA